MLRCSLFDDFPPPKKYLYHYTTAETALTKIIAGGKLRAGPFRTMNDPRESKEWLFGARALIEDPIASEGAIEASKIAQACTRVVAFSTDADEAAQRGADCHFGRGFAHSAMWNHYARQHTGACLIFDREKLEEAVFDSLGVKDGSTANGWVFFGPVRYANLDRRYDVSSENPFMFDLENRDVDLRRLVLRHVKRVHEELFFCKSIDWGYEREYRCIVWDEGEDGLFLDIGDSLAGIVVTEDYGMTAGSEGLAKVGYVRALQETCRRFRISARVLYWDNGVPKLGELNRN